MPARTSPMPATSDEELLCARDEVAEAFTAPADTVSIFGSLPHEQIIIRFVDRALRFRSFFARKLTFVRYVSAFVGFGMLGELFEALMLTQTRKLRHFPVVLAVSGRWRGLDAWIHERSPPVEASALAIGPRRS